MHNEKEFFLQNLGMLLRSGMPVREALESLEGEIRSRKMQAAISKVEEAVDDGANLSKALKEGKLISGRYVFLLELGEETGQLSKQLSLIIEQQKKEHILKSRVRGALLYPLFVLSVLGIVGILTLWYSLPKLVAVFSQSGGTLPITTRALLAVGTFLSEFGIYVVPLGILLLCALVYFLFIYSKTRIVGERLLCSLPVLKKIVQQIELARFGYMLGTLLEAGVSVPQALESLQGSTSFVMYKRMYSDMLERINAGSSIYSAVTESTYSKQCVPGHVARLLYAGEMSGSLSTTLLSIGENYEREGENLAQNVTALLEPIIIVLVGLLVAVVALSILTPIYGLVTQIQ